jgi:hypothetical protein
MKWKISRGNGVMPGDVVGKRSDQGYLRVCMHGKNYRVHILAYIFMEGYTPEHTIDHIDGVRDNNKWSNLRHVSLSCNAQNRAINKNNTSRYPGVCFHKQLKKWVSVIRINGKLLHLGVYDSAMEAALARFTVESNCAKWTCNKRSELSAAIKKEWPEFKFY